jgi:Transposase
VDLLADREAACVARWLREHPGVKFISRDRAGMYAEGAKRGAPRAKQIADRYHLLVNLRDTLKDALARYQNSLPVVEERGKPAGSSSEEPAQPSPAIPVQAPPKPEAGEAGSLSAETLQLTAAQRRRQVSRANRYARYQQIQALSREGLSQRAIARQLHLSSWVCASLRDRYKFSRTCSTRQAWEPARSLPTLPSPALGTGLPQWAAAHL